jgi:pimeloyl-ACP methyl ester carboxylesterase
MIGVRMIDTGGPTLSALVRDGAPGAPTILLIHPANLRGATWRAVVDALDPALRCVMPDLTGHGDSARTERYSVQAWCEDCERVLDALGVEQVHAVGASVGAAIAVALAARRPGAVLSLGTVGGALRPAPVDGDTLLAALAGGATIDDLRVEMARASVAPGLPTAALERIAADVSANAPETLAAVWRAALATDVAPQLPALYAPCWSVVGEHDQSCPPEESAWFATAVAGELHVLDGVGHLPMYEAPERLAALIARAAVATPNRSD